MSVRATFKRGKTWASSSGAGDRDGAVWGLSGQFGSQLARVGTLLIVLLSPVVTTLIYIINDRYDGDLRYLWAELNEKGMQEQWATWPTPWGPKGLQAWRWFATFGTLQATLQLIVPGKAFYGPISPNGNTPVYKANGVACFLVTAVLFFGAARAKLFDPAHLYDIFGEMLAVCNLFAWFLCVALTLKGLHYPSTSDSGSTGSVIYDFYWGTELYPRIGRWFDIKTWTNCRMGMMSWTFIVVSFAYKQAELYGIVSNGMLITVVLAALYNLKFFLWETGYWKTMDIAHDRAGFYLCWGCLNWVPGIYTSQALFLTKHPCTLKQAAGIALLLAGMSMIYINWEADFQRQRFRESEGRCLIWSKPPRYVRAKYVTGDGIEKTSLLLASGWWGVARHFHYVPEVLSSVCWTAPAGFAHAMPWIYSIFLTLLLLDRLCRDNTRCKAKYGRSWDEYCQIVPYHLLPPFF